jgi:C-terminal peptidase prc
MMPRWARIALLGAWGFAGCGLVAKLRADDPGAGEQIVDGDGIVASEAEAGVVPLVDPEVPVPYTKTVDLIQRLYMYVDRVSPQGLFAAAAIGLERGVDWLHVDVRDGVARLRHGGGRDLGAVTVTGWGDLAAGLYGLEKAVYRAGVPWGAVNLRLTLLAGLTTELDPYSRILAGDKLDSFDTRLKGTLVGIGASLKRVDDRIVITDVQPDGPAALAGVTPGDVVLAIDDTSTLNLPVREAVRKIRGERDTDVRLRLLRGGAELDVTLTRAQVVVDNVRHEALDGGVGYVRVESVSQQTLSNLTRALALLAADDAAPTGLILDLRGNTGGSMKESAAVVDHFVKGGVVLTTQGRDGHPVADLVPEIDADDDLAEPDLPIIVLVDPKTASGAEIISGALLGLDRAALVGQRTFGKGQVQKVYTLEPGLSFKLTVAEYRVTDDVAVVDVGVQPDVHVGHIVVAPDAVRVEGFDLVRERVPWDAIVPAVSMFDGSDRSDGGDAPPIDVPRELARRALVSAASAARDDLTAALADATRALRAEQEAALQAALAPRAVDWSTAPAEGPAPVARVEVSVGPLPTPDPAAPDDRQVTVRVRNAGAEPLYRAWVQLDCATFSPWDDLAFPVGKLAPGELREVTARVKLAPGVLERADVAQVTLRTDRRPTVQLPDAVLRAATTADPHLRVAAQLLPLPDAPGDYDVAVTLTNRSDIALTGLEVWSEAPSDARLELLQAGARVDQLAPRGTATLHLRLRRGAPGVQGPESFPLQLTVEADRFGVLFTPEVTLDVDGRVATREAPVVTLGRHPLTAAAGRLSIPVEVTDDGRLEDIVLFHNGEKLLWHDGGTSRQRLQLVIQLVSGVNTLVVAATDETGTRTQLTWRVLGEGPVPQSTPGSGALDDGRSWAPRARGHHGQDG